MRWFAGIARILPVNVPARLKFEVEASMIARTWKELSLAKDKLYVHMGRIGGTRRGARGQTCSKQEEKRDNEVWKTHGFDHPP